MKYGMHTASIMQSNLMSDIRLAREVGYDAIELRLTKMQSYFDVGFTLNDLKEVLNGFPVSMLGCMLPIEKQDPEFRKQLRTHCETYCSWAQALNCHSLQVVALHDLKDLPRPQHRKLMADALRELAEIAGQFDVNLVVEPVVFAPFHSIEQYNEVHQEAGRDNIKIVIDTFHLWTAHIPWQQVAEMDKEMIACVHLSDTHPKQGEQWHDDDRTALLGDGIVPIPEAIAAIKSNGFDGIYSVEMMSKIHYQWDPEVVVKELKKRTEYFLEDIGADPTDQARRKR